MKSYSTIDFFSDELSQTMKDMYGRDRLADFPLFQGGYINFGFWKDIDYQRALVVEDRILSSRNLYLHIIEQLPHNRSKRVLEVGSGHGLGCALVLKHLMPEKIVGLDITEQHVEIAKRNNVDLINHEKVHFLQGDAENMNFSENEFDCLFSIEAVQHLTNFENFLTQAWRVLSDDAFIIITSFFLQKASRYSSLQALIPDMDKAIGMGPPIQDVIELFQKAGFSNVNYYSIGQYVWKGFDKWMAVIPEFRTTWGRNWLTAYQLDLVDYYVISATKKV